MSSATSALNKNLPQYLLSLSNSSQNEQNHLREQLTVLEQLLPEETDKYLVSLHLIKSNISKISKLLPQEQLNLILRESIDRMHQIAVRMLETNYIDISLSILNDCDILSQLYPIALDMRIKTLNHLSCCLRIRKDFSRALKILDKAQVISQQFNNKSNGTTLLNKSVVLNELGRQFKMNDKQSIHSVLFLTRFQEGLSYAKMAVKELTIEFDEAFQAKINSKHNKILHPIDEERFKLITTELAISFHNLAQQQLHFKQTKMSVQNFYSAYIVLNENQGENHPLIGQFLNSLNLAQEEYQRSCQNGTEKIDVKRRFNYQVNKSDKESRNPNKSDTTTTKLDIHNNSQNQPKQETIKSSKADTNTTITQKVEASLSQSMLTENDERLNTKKMQMRLKQLEGSLDDYSRTMQKSHRHVYELLKRGGWSGSQEKINPNDNTLQISKLNNTKQARIQNYKTQYMNSARCPSSKESFQNLGRTQKQFRETSPGKNWLKKVLEHLKIDEWRNSSQIISKVCKSREESDSSRQINSSTLQLQTQPSHQSQPQASQRQTKSHENILYNNQKFNNFFNKKINRLYDNAKLNNGLTRPMSAQELLKRPSIRNAKKYVDNSQLFIPGTIHQTNPLFTHSLDKNNKRRENDTNKIYMADPIEKVQRKSMIEIGSRKNYIDTNAKKEPSLKQSVNVSADSIEKPLTASSNKGSDSILTSIDSKTFKEQIQKMKNQQATQAKINSLQSARSNAHSSQSKASSRLKESLLPFTKKQVSQQKPQQSLVQDQIKQQQKEQQQQQQYEEEEEKETLELHFHSNMQKNEETTGSDKKSNELTQNKNQSSQIFLDSSKKWKEGSAQRSQSIYEEHSKNENKSMSEVSQIQQDWQLICEQAEGVVRTVSGGMKQGKLGCLFDNKTYSLSIIYQEKGSNTINCKLTIDCSQIRQCYAYEQEEEGGKGGKQSTNNKPIQQDTDQKDKSPQTPQKDQKQQQEVKEESDSKEKEKNDELQQNKKQLIQKSMENVFKGAKIIILYDSDKKQLSIPQASIQALSIIVYTPLHNQGISTKLSLNKIQVSVKQQHSQQQSQGIRRSYSVQAVDLQKISLEIPPEESFLFANIQRLKNLNSEQFQILSNYQICTVSGIKGILASYIDSFTKSLCFSYKSQPTQLDLTHILFVQPIVDDYGEFSLSENTRIALNLLAKSLKELWIIEYNTLTYISNQWSLRNEMEVKNKGIKQFTYQLVQQTGNSVSVIEKQEQWIEIFQQITKDGLHLIEESQESEDESKFYSVSKNSFLHHANTDELKSPNTSSAFKTMQKYDNNNASNNWSKKLEQIKNLEDSGESANQLSSEQYTLNAGEENKGNTQYSHKDNTNNMYISEGSFYELEQIKGTSQDKKQSSSRFQDRPISSQIKLRAPQQTDDLSLNVSQEKEGDVEYIDVNEEKEEEINEDLQ